MKSTRHQLMFWRAIICLEVHVWIIQVESTGGCSYVGTMQELQLNITCDSSLDVYVDGKYIGSKEYPTIGKYVINTGSEVVAVKCRGKYSAGKMILASLSNGLITDHTWKCSSKVEPGWSMKTFDDLDWTPAAELLTNSHSGLVLPWGNKLDIAQGAKFIWAADVNNQMEIYCRRSLVTACSEKRIRFFTSKSEWKDKVLKSWVIKTTTVTSVLECGMRCLNTPLCLSFNTEYNTSKPDRRCELNKQKDFVSLSSGKDFQYFEIVKAGY